MERFKNRVVLVTGAGSGIGAAIAVRLAEEQATVIVADKSLELASAVAGSLRGRGAPLRLDVTSDDDTANLAEQIRARHGHLDALVNNAGIHFGGSFEDTNFDQWRLLMAVNVEGAMRVSLACLPFLKNPGHPGAIVNISSISGLGGDYGQAAYATSKGAIAHLTRSMALDLAKHGVRVNAVCPGSVKTPMFDAAVAKLDPQRVDEVFAATYPMGRIAEASEVAAAVAFLASEDASFITGVNLPVDGGLTAHNGAPRFG
ncbi:SDR family NAD(P)-dependent oxidoreductase [Paraburkholderia terrae]|uniref:3-oxoacyl-ACP reductase n=1 Tax=Paraburkholderia terrae TaxID=311230 RepID=A0ABM7U2M8_9BURK|nr:SDR family oxidoreductase [Paraburkholderia terrae]BCZ85596.1 3-oxoacyl-ACP reductase [Paraburkholderia terrae]BDC45948.1 3-oxoacyl-ACP reductase [Paraburkholderia terrae]